MTRSVVTREGFKPIPVPREDVAVPEFGEGAVIPVWGMTARQRAQFDLSLTGKDRKIDPAKHRQYRERLVVACCRDDEGIPIFSAEDVEVLADQDFKIINRLFSVAWRLCGFDDKDVAALEKNCEGTTRG